jgi:hypothetical protein
VKAWHAAVAAIVLLIPQVSTAADDLAGAARELARKTSAWGRGPVTATYRNISSLPDIQLTAARQEFERAVGGPPEGPAIEARITLSENVSQFLLVEEARRGEETQVWIAGWPRGERPPVSNSGVTLEKRLVWEQDEPILDLAFAAEGTLVLTPTQLIWRRAQGPPQSLPVEPKIRVRDPRGRLRVTGDRVQAFLPGVVCNGLVQTALAVECHASDEPWVLESGSRAILLANFAAGRNYFDGRVVSQNGLRRSVARFYSAAAFEESGGLSWLVTLVDGKTQILDASFDPAGEFAGWGSDVAGLGASCNGGSPILSTRPGDADEPDAVQAFMIVNRAAVPVAAPVPFPGPVTALWSSSSGSVLAVSRDPATSRYAAYTLTMVCNR